MRIAVISMIRDAWGGSEEIWYDMAKEALKQGHQIYHVAYQVGKVHPKTTELLQLGVVQFYRPSLQIPSSCTVWSKMQKRISFFFKKRWNNAIKQVMQLNPDVVLYNGTCYSIKDEEKLLSQIQKTQTPLYIIGHYTNEFECTLSKLEQSIVLKAYKLAKQVFFVSNRMKDTVEKQLNSKINNCTIIRNPINLPEIGIITYPSSINPIQIAVVGNLICLHKGQDKVLQIFSGQSWKNNNWHINFYGDGIDKQFLVDLSKKLNINHQVSFHGRVNNIQDVWKANHILLMPSSMEGMPLALVEAMLCGRTAIVTDVGGNTDWIEDEVTGFVAKNTTTASIEDAINRAFLRKVDWESMGKAAFDKAIHLYDKHAGKTLLNLILPTS